MQAMAGAVLLACWVGWLAAGFAEPGSQPGKEPGSYVKVEIKGKLATGVVAIGGETTGTTITAGDITWDLDFGENKELAVQAEKLDGKTVVVTGTARQVRGVTRGPRIVVTVATLKASER